jgi:hypothetical protein
MCFLGDKKLILVYYLKEIQSFKGFYKVSKEMGVLA